LRFAGVELALERHHAPRGEWRFSSSGVYSRVSAECRIQAPVANDFLSPGEKRGVVVLG
jgi:hypothetical protein